MSSVVASATITAPARSERGEVGLGDRDPDRVEVDPGRGEPGGGRRDQVAADAAAEVDQGRGRRPPAAGRRGARRPAAGSPARGPSGVKYIRAARSPNFGLGPPPQLDLGQRGRDVGGGGRRAAARTGRASSSPPAATAAVAAASSCLPVVGEQPPERVEVHAGDPVRARAVAWHSVGESASVGVGTLALRVPALATDARPPRRRTSPAGTNVPERSGSFTRVEEKVEVDLKCRSTSSPSRTGSS